MKTLIFSMLGWPVSATNGCDWLTRICVGYDWILNAVHKSGCIVQSTVPKLGFHTDTDQVAVLINEKSEHVEHSLNQFENLAKRRPSGLRIVEIWRNSGNIALHGGHHGAKKSINHGSKAIYPSVHLVGVRLTNSFSIDSFAKWTISVASTGPIYSS